VVVEVAVGPGGAPVAAVGDAEAHAAGVVAPAAAHAAAHAEAHAAAHAVAAVAGRQGTPAAPVAA
jgi:hypothetical protein